MKHQELRNHILGSHLMGHDLEAFLVQNAYIESLLKVTVDYHFQNESKAKPADNKLLRAVKRDVEKYSLANVVDLLKRAELISPDLRKQLDDYRIIRQKALHDLLSQDSAQTLGPSLRDAYELGKKITESVELKEMEGLVGEYAYIEMESPGETPSSPPRPTFK